MNTPLKSRTSLPSRRAADGARARSRLPGPRLRRALGGARVLDLRLRGRQPRDRHHQRRAGHVRHADAVAELDGRWLSAVLAADPDLEAGARLPPALDSDLDQ